MTSGIRYVVTTSQQFAFATGRSLDWGGFSPSGAYTLDAAKGKIYFPMTYSRGNASLFFLWVLLIAVNVIACGTVAYGFWRAANAFNFSVVINKVREYAKKSSPRSGVVPVLIMEEKKI
jgi:hypothetical protein